MFSPGIFPSAIWSHLAFVVPPPEGAIGPLTNGLRLMITEFGVQLLHLFELPVAREGNLILLPKETLFVAEACSGIGSIFTLTPVAACLAALLWAVDRPLDMCRTVVNIWSDTMGTVTIAHTEDEIDESALFASADSQS